MKPVKRFLIVLGGMIILAAAAARAQDDKPPVRIAIVGLTHDHAIGFIPNTPISFFTSTGKTFFSKLS